MSRIYLFLRQVGWADDEERVIRLIEAFLHPREDILAMPEFPVRAQTPVSEPVDLPRDPERPSLVGLLV